LIEPYHYVPPEAANLNKAIVKNVSREFSASLKMLKYGLGLLAAGFVGAGATLVSDHSIFPILSGTSFTIGALLSASAIERIKSV
jgi:hypothetical protein